jgi:hypothetical protein
LGFNLESIMQSAAGFPTKARMADTTVLVQQEMRCAADSARAPRAGSMDEAQDLQLIQMRHDEYVAQKGLQRLFESGQLEVLSV